MRELESTVDKWDHRSVFCKPKHLYDKANKNRDNKTKQENFMRRFLDGMWDNETHFEIEYYKEPNDIDKAVEL